MAKNENEGGDLEKQSSIGLKDEHKLFLNESTLKNSLAVLRVAVFASSLQSGLMNPNYPFLASIGTHPVSFAGLIVFSNILIQVKINSYLLHFRTLSQVQLLLDLQVPRTGYH